MSTNLWLSVAGKTSCGMSGGKQDGNGHMVSASSQTPAACQVESFGMDGAWCHVTCSLKTEVLDRSFVILADLMGILGGNRAGWSWIVCQRCVCSRAPCGMWGHCNSPEAEKPWDSFWKHKNRWTFSLFFQIMDKERLDLKCAPRQKRRLQPENVDSSVHVLWNKELKTHKVTCQFFHLLESSWLILETVWSIKTVL